MAIKTFVLNITPETSLEDFWLTYARAKYPAEFVADTECRQYKELRGAFMSGCGFILQVLRTMGGNVPEDKAVELLDKWTVESMPFRDLGGRAQNMKGN